MTSPIHHASSRRGLKVSARSTSANFYNVVILLVLLLGLLSRTSRADDDLMRELLEEQRRQEEERLQESGHQYDDAYLQQQQEEMVRQKRAREEEANVARERLVEQEKERIRQQREAAFETKLARMNEEQQKEAIKQKQKDAKVVKKIIKAANREDYYAVLGLMNFDITVGPFRIFGYTFGPFTFLRPSSKDIKKAYRNRAMLTHPDKNRDGRAQEAFVAVEESASILTNDREREEYDGVRKALRIKQRAMIMGMIATVTNAVRHQVSRVIWIFKNLLGPFATPIFIISCLII